MNRFHFIKQHPWVLLAGAELFLLLLLLLSLLSLPHPAPSPAGSARASGSDSSPAPIRWVDFQITAEAMGQALRWDTETYGTASHLDWISLLAVLGARYGGDFSRFRQEDLDQLAKQLQEGTQLSSLTQGLSFYDYYLEAYTAVLGGMTGPYEIQEPDESGKPVWVKKYGLKAFSPIARFYPYQDYNDFGVSRSYGYQRRHLGHDMMGQVGTPIICVESGRVEAMGWNPYGGWRLGIRSFDQKRYYYYAHLRKNYPYHKSLSVGSVVQAGDVIGYLGRTGYSSTENTNNIDEPHLHFGIQLIFDPSQKESVNEIWIDCYQLVQFLSLQRSETLRDPETKEHFRKWQIKDPAAAGEAREQVLPAPADSY